MTERSDSCPSCGSSRDSFVEGRLCPSCLLQLALADTEADGGEGAPGAEERYVVRAVMDDAAEATAYLAEDSLSRRLVRLEIGKRRCEIDTAAFKARIEGLRRRAAEGVARVLDGGLTADGRPWLVTERTPAARGWALLELQPTSSFPGSPPRRESGP